MNFETGNKALTSFYEAPKATIFQYLLHSKGMFLKFFQMSQLLSLLLSRREWRFWQHGEHLLRVDVHWVVQVFLGRKNDAHNISYFKNTSY